MKIIATQSQILKVSAESPSVYIGYDVFTGELTEVIKSDSLIVTEPIKRLISDEKARVLVSWNLGKTVKGSAKIFGCTQRTFQRLLNTHIYEK